MRPSSTKCHHKLSSDCQAWLSLCNTQLQYGFGDGKGRANGAICFINSSFFLKITLLWCKLKQSTCIGLCRFILTYDTTTFLHNLRTSAFWFISRLSQYYLCCHMHASYLVCDVRIQCCSLRPERGP